MQTIAVYRKVIHIKIHLQTCTTPYFKYPTSNWREDALRQATSTCQFCRSPATAAGDKRRGPPARTTCSSAVRRELVGSPIPVIPASYQIFASPGCIIRVVERTVRRHPSNAASDVVELHVNNSVTLSSFLVNAVIVVVVTM